MKSHLCSESYAHVWLPLRTAPVIGISYIFLIKGVALIRRWLIIYNYVWLPLGTASIEVVSNLCLPVLFAQDWLVYQAYVDYYYALCYKHAF
jgi:hypothetical protein